MPSTEVDLSKAIHPDKMNELREAFKEFDKDSDGHITKEELASVMSSYGNVISSTDLDIALKSVDIDGNGVVDFKEFLELMEGNTLVESVDAEMKGLFDMFDIDRDEFITEKEIKTVMKKLGEKVKKKQLRKMIKEADDNKDGKISFNEFKTMLETGNFLGGPE